MARARPSAAGGGAASPERAGPGRPPRSPASRPRLPERPGLRLPPGTPGLGAGRRAAKLSPGRGWWALLALLLHLLPALEQDDVAPYFKTEPGLPQIHLEGNRLVLTCLAEGSWPLEFKWMRNDSELTTYSSEYRYGKFHGHRPEENSFSRARGSSKPNAHHQPPQATSDLV